MQAWRNVNMCHFYRLQLWSQLSLLQEANQRHWPPCTCSYPSNCFTFRVTGVRGHPPSILRGGSRCLCHKRALQSHSNKIKCFFFFMVTCDCFYRCSKNRPKMTTKEGSWMTNMDGAHVTERKWMLDQQYIHLCYEVKVTCLVCSAGHPRRVFGLADTHR